MASTTPDLPETESDDVTPERALAYDLLGQEGRLWSEILYELLGQPQRYSDLKPLLGDQAENTLTYALEKLVDEGLVKRTSDVVDDELVKRYAISRKGIDVFLHMHLLETIGEFVASTGSPARRSETLQDAGEVDRVITNANLGNVAGVLGARDEPYLSPGDAAVSLTEEDEADVDVLVTSEGVRAKEVSYINFVSESEGRGREGHIYHVRPTPDAKWSLKREGAQRATKRFDKSRLAVARGLELAGENGKVFVHDPKGEVETVLGTSTREAALPG